MRLCVYHLPTKLWPLILETPISCALRPFPQHNISWFAQDKGLTFLGGNLCVSLVSDHKAWLCATSLYSDSVRTVHDSVIPGRNSTVCTRLYVVCLSIFCLRSQTFWHWRCLSLLTKIAQCLSIMKTSHWRRNPSPYQG